MRRISPWWRGAVSQEHTDVISNKWLKQMNQWLKNLVNLKWSFAAIEWDQQFLPYRHQAFLFIFLAVYIVVRSEPIFYFPGLIYRFLTRVPHCTCRVTIKTSASTLLLSILTDSSVHVLNMCPHGSGLWDLTCETTSLGSTEPEVRLAHPQQNMHPPPPGIRSST